MASKLYKLTELFYKSAQRGRVVVPRWQLQQQENQRQQREPSGEGEIGLMDMRDFSLEDFDEGIVPQFEPQYENVWTQGPQEPQETIPEEITGPKIIDPAEKSTKEPKEPKEKRKKKPARPKLKSDEELAAEYWSKIPREKHNDPEYYRSLPPEEQEQSRKKWRERLREQPGSVFEREHRVLSEEEAFEQAQERLSEIKNELNEISEEIKPNLLTKVTDEKAAKEAFRKLKQAGEEVKVIDVQFPKTKVGNKVIKPFTKWAVVKWGTAYEVVNSLLKRYELMANYNDILTSMKKKQKREIPKEKDRFEQFFS